MVNLRSYLSLLPFLSGDAIQKRDIQDVKASAVADASIYNSVVAIANLSNAPLQPATIRCYSLESCVAFAYPAVVLEPSSHIAQAVCPTRHSIIITFSSHAAFVTAEGWPMANLVLIGQGYPGCGPAGGEGRFYAITQSTIVDSDSRSISANIIYLTADEVTVASGTSGSKHHSFTTTSVIVEHTTTADGSSTTIFSTAVQTLYPTLILPTSANHSTTSLASSALPSTSVSSSSPSSLTSATSTKSTSPTETSSCLDSGDGFWTDSLGITYESRCNWVFSGEQIASFGPGQTAEQCLQSCSMIFPECQLAVFSSESGYCSLQSPPWSQEEVLFGYDSYLRVSEYVGTNTSAESSQSQPTSATSTLSSSSSSTMSTSTLISSGSLTITTSISISASTLISASTSTSTSTSISSSLSLNSSLSTPSSTVFITSIATTTTAVIPTITSKSIPTISALPSASDGNICPNVGNGVFIDANQQTYDVYCGSNVVADFLSAMYYVDTDSDCLLFCDQTEGCVAASYLVHSYSACFMWDDVQTVLPGVAGVDAFVLSTSFSAPTSLPTPSTTTMMPSPQTGFPLTCPEADHNTYVDPVDKRTYKVYCQALLIDPMTGGLTRYQSLHGRYTFTECANLCESGTCPAFVYSQASLACGLYSDSVDDAAAGVAGSATAVTLISAVTLTPSSTSSSPLKNMTLSTSSYTSSATSQLSSSQTALTSLPMPSPTLLSLCPEYNGSTFKDDDGDTYNVTCSYDIPGGDLGQPVYGLTTDQQCLETCDGTPECVGVVFASTTCDDNWCHCFLKYAIEPVNANSNYNFYVKISDNSTTTSTSSTLMSSTALPLPTASPLLCSDGGDANYTTSDGTVFEIRCDMDMKGGPFIGRSVQESFEDCIDSCDAMGTAICQGVSWVPAGQDSTYCWYKTTLDQFTPEPAGFTVDSAQVVVNGTGS